MATVKEKKKISGWRSSGPMCENCTHYSSEISRKKVGHFYCVKESRKRCTLQGFAVNKRAWCTKHEFRRT